jgi:hypothetical protein
MIADHMNKLPAIKEKKTMATVTKITAALSPRIQKQV